MFWEHSFRFFLYRNKNMQDLILDLFYIANSFKWADPPLESLPVSRHLYAEGTPPTRQECFTCAWHIPGGFLLPNLRKGNNLICKLLILTQRLYSPRHNIHLFWYYLFIFVPSSLRSSVQSKNQWHSIGLTLVQLN